MERHSLGYSVDLHAEEGEEGGGGGGGEGARAGGGVIVVAIVVIIVNKVLKCFDVAIYILVVYCNL